MNRTQKVQLKCKVRVNKIIKILFKNHNIRLINKKVQIKTIKFSKNNNQKIKKNKINKLKVIIAMRSNNNSNNKKSLISNNKEMVIIIITLM